jgi:N-acetylglucosaminylphosphatidylinositol deacetylase
MKKQRKCSDDYLKRFFVPTISSLRADNKLFLLCLSNGNFDGLGRVREKELEQSCKFLELQEGPIVIDDPDLKDGMQNRWAKELVSNQIDKILRNMAANDQAVDIIITFDERGVSGHPNHIDVHHGLMYLSKKTFFRFLS